MAYPPVFKEKDIDAVLSELNKSFASGKTKSFEWRYAQIDGVQRFLTENENALKQALATDLGRCEFEAIGLELLGCSMEADYIKKNLKEWMKPVKTPVPLVMAPASSEILRDPFGTCLLLGPFNYPVILLLSPLLGALAAGNCVLIKPSEMCGAVERVVFELLPKYVDSTCVKVVLGAVETTTLLLQRRFDKIFFTGSPRVGKIVMRAAAEHLTPVCLELGGKSPTIIDESATDLELVAQRVMWGKCANAGQTCIAPDYVFCHEKHYEAFLQHAQKKLLQFYGEDPQAADSYGRIVSEGHCHRLKGMIDECGSRQIVCGGKVDVNDKFVQPTILKNVSMDSKVMTEEIFGPVLPVLKYSHLDEVIQHVAAGERPLTIYVFGKNRANIDRVVTELSSGSVLVNDTLFQFANIFAPFGGIGNSGLGGYHGKFSFDAFTHQRSVLRRDDHMLLDVPVRYPPYTDFGLKFFRFAASLPMTQPPITTAGVLKTSIVFAAVVGCAAYYLQN